MSTWGEFAAAHPSLAAFGAGRLRRAPAYLATVTAEGRPRVHPVTPIIGVEHLFLFLEPSSPKGRDLRERGGYALHNAVPDNQGTGGEFYLRGNAILVEDDALRPLPCARQATHQRSGTSYLSCTSPRRAAMAMGTSRCRRRPTGARSSDLPRR